LSRDVVDLIHEEQLREHGGASGIRDEGLLESALARPLNQWVYTTCDLADLAASHAFGIARNHPFIDGNKRTAFLAAYTFLGINGFDIVTTDAEVILAILALAAGELDEAGLAAWIRDRMSGG
jgi:death-on-curing protein